MSAVDTTLENISKEFGISFEPIGGRWGGVHRSISRTWKAAAKLTRRHSRTLPIPSIQSAHAQPERWRLPIELIEQIIDHLHDDLQTLRTLALVSYALLPAARYHIFHRIIVHERNYVESVRLFVKNPGLAEYVRDLYLEADGRAFEALQALQQKAQPSKLLRVFTLLLAPLMCNTVHLSLKDVPVNPEIVAMLAPHFPRLHSLSLFDCWFRHNADLDTLVRCYPNLRTLRCGRLCSLYGASERPDQEFTELPKTAAIPVQTLKVTEAYAPSPLTLMPWLVGHIHPETFAYTLYRLSQVAKLNQAISGYDSMRHLHLIFYHWRRSDTEEVIECPHVMAITPRYPANITTLTLDAKLYSLLLVVNLLAQLDPHSFRRLRTVNIIAHLRVEDVEEIEWTAWAGMERTLSVLLSLGAVNFTNSCSDSSHVEEGCEAIVARLRVLDIRGMLSFAAVKVTA
ncbi:hypothetical protein GY45DRAFT_1437382 [Cubamyces sp. BRFM 1775]|nr:hypothetical protein GY45DRAFT_1437382 [Cubamyces sp. BRFM 1775]